VDQPDWNRADGCRCCGKLRFAISAALAATVGLGWLTALPAAGLNSEDSASIPAMPTPQHSHAGHALGQVDFPVSCSPAAQSGFDEAMALLHHMTYPQAREAFGRVAAIHPACAMAHWGIAMTLFQPLWPTRPGVKEREQGWQAVQAAQALQPPTARERRFIASAEAFFREPASPDYWLRIRRWAEATATLHAALPDDPEAALLHALGLLATAPADRISRVNADQAAAMLLQVHARHPDHPGAMHYLVHANDVPGRERESQDVLRQYEAVAPRNPHALHMPTHVYTRLGDWPGVVRGNLRAAEAALEYPAGEHGEFVWDEFPHAIEYLVHAYLQQGADDAAGTQLRRLRGTPRLEPSFKTAFHLASTQARFALERRDWAAAAALVAREPATLDWDRFPWPEAITWFARGLGAAHEGRLEATRAARARLRTLETSARASGEELFARNIAMLRLELDAWRAHVERRDDASLAMLREAAELERSTPKHAVTPGPTLPADELLGDLLMELSRPAEALVAYRRALDAYPNRFNSLLGAARAAHASGDAGAAAGFYRDLLGIAQGSTREAALGEAKAFLERPGQAPRRGPA
jgi:tetratricopeptide (TPR) repeat protein